MRRFPVRPSDFLDLFGVLCLTALAFLVWPPAALGVLGASALVASWAMERKR